MLAALLVLVAALLSGLDEAKVSLQLEMRSTPVGKGEIFYADAGERYSQKSSKPFPLQADGRWHNYEIPLPSVRMERIRIDPGSGNGAVEVRSVEVRSGSKALQFSGPQLRDAVGVTHHLQPRPETTGALGFQSTGRDPYFEVRLPEAIGKTSLLHRLGVLVAAAGLAFLGWLALERLSALFRRHVRVPCPAIVRRICEACSDDDILRIDGGILASFLAILLAGLFYVALGLNQSSLGWWENIYPYQPVHQTIDLGTAKRIRSDEWNVQAPWVLNQVRNGSPLNNPNVGAEGSPLIASLPVSGAIDLPQVKFLGFEFLGVDRGVSWWWAYKTFALLWSFLWLCLLLTRGNLAASLLGTAWIYTSSFTQWWFSSNLPEIMTAFALGVVGAIYALFSTRRRMVAVGCALIVYSAANLVLNLYPPFIVPLGYLAVAILAGYAIQRRGTGAALHGLRFRSAAIALAAVVVVAYVWMFMATAADSIQAMLHTVYPGKRVAGSGGIPFTKVFYGFFEGFRFDEFHFPPFSSNASETSSFVLLLPLAVLAIPLGRLFRRDNALLVAIGCAWLLTGLWILFKLPGPIERMMQIAGWSLVTPKRAVLAFGVGSILACIVLFAKMLEGREPAYPRDVRRMAVVVVLTGVCAFGWGLHQVDAGFFTWRLLLAGAVASTLAGAGILMGRTSLLAVGLALFALPTLTVNPLVSGISAISEKPILKTAARLGAGPDVRWAVVGNPTLAQGLKAHGLKVLAGTQFLPNRQDFHILDPKGMHEATWNRYATIGIGSDPHAKTPRFTRRRGDQYTITLNVCGGMLQALGVTHVAYTMAVPPADLECLTPLPADPGSGVALFALKRQGTY
ncbi:DUF7657 domain-containing protein [Luteimonas sp. 22616]|uniref:DUF7657 domain-containing protein n=1 Tax=Luteimonas sp. 22616 TaxID=3453951 RepID=UPI003F84F491